MEQFVKVNNMFAEMPKGDSVDVDFGGVMLRIEKVENTWKVANAMDGYGINRKADYENEKVLILEPIEVKEADDNIKDFLQQFEHDPYPEDIFLPVSEEELSAIDKMLLKEFNMPIDRLSGHIGRLILKPLQEDALVLLNSYKPIEVTPVSDDEVKNKVYELLYANLKFGCEEKCTCHAECNKADNLCNQILKLLHSYKS